jgi:type-F conjugative transfer system pilin assembly protein TrbC
MLRAMNLQRLACSRWCLGIPANALRELAAIVIELLWAVLFVAASVLLIGALSLAIWSHAEASDQGSDSALKALTQDAFRRLDAGTATGNAPQGADDKDLQAAEAKAKTYHQDMMEQAATSRTPLPRLPNLDNLEDLLRKAGPKQPVDVNDLAQQGKQLMNPYAGQDEDRYATRVLVFVSSSLPDTVIQNYLRQTQRIGGAVVFRGLVNNTMQDMRDYLARQIAALKETSGDHSSIEPSILIDPTLFRRFDIDQAPVTVATEADIKPCITDQTPQGCPTPPFHIVRGDVSLAWALGLISRQSDSEALKARLRPLIRDLEQMI